MVHDSAPIITTDRLSLRPFLPADAPAVQSLANDSAIAATTLSIPHPYTVEMAREWIRSLPEKIEAGELMNFAMIHHTERHLIGAIGLRLEPQHARAELGYWVGKPYWNRGYCTEAALAVVRFGFEELHLHRIYAMFFTRNANSERVLQKVGLEFEGVLRQHVRKNGRSHDVVIYGMTRPDFIQNYG